MKSSLTKTGEGAVGALVEAKRGEVLDFSAPFAREILLFDEVGVAGTRSIFNIDEVFSTLHIGDRVTFLRDPENIDDKWAVGVFSANNCQVGYLSSDCEEVVARLMDAGKTLFGKVINAEIRGSWHLIELEVYLDD